MLINIGIIPIISSFVQTIIQCSNCYSALTSKVAIKFPGGIECAYTVKSGGGGVFGCCSCYHTAPPLFFLFSPPSARTGRLTPVYHGPGWSYNNLPEGMFTSVISCNYVYLPPMYPQQWKPSDGWHHTEISDAITSLPRPLPRLYHRLPN